MYYCFRLKNGMDLKEELEKFAKNNSISGTILCSVGCLKELKIRLADGESVLERKEQFEIVSVMGTLSKDGVHIHISVSDTNGNTIGGHLMNGCIINTTAEVVILNLDKFLFERNYDESTGYKELEITNL